MGNIGICNSQNEKKNNLQTNKSFNNNYNARPSNNNSNFNEEFTKHDEIHPPVPLNLIFEAIKSVCLIILNNRKQKSVGNGFFLNLSNTKKYLVTAGHIFKAATIESEINLQIYNNKIMKFNLINRDYLYFAEKIDILLIEMKDTDEIYNDVKFLYYDSNYEKEYGLYKNLYVFTIEHIIGENAACASGQIIDVQKYFEYEFTHTIPTDRGSSGCPIILLNNNINIIRVIGIHISKDTKQKVNIGIFIGEILKKENSKYLKKIKMSGDIEVRFVFLLSDICNSHTLICKLTDNFSSLESKLFYDFPELRNKVTNFTANGNTINREGTLEQNKIEDQTSIYLF